MTENPKRRRLPHQETNPPFSVEQIFFEEDEKKKLWMIRMNEEWADALEEERRNERKRRYGY